MSLFTAMYTPEESACYAASVKHAVSERLERRPQVLAKDTALRQLAKSSRWYGQFGGKPPREVDVAVENQPGGDRSSDRPSSTVATKGTLSSSAGVAKL